MMRRVVSHTHTVLLPRNTLATSVRLFASSYSGSFVEYTPRTKFDSRSSAHRHPPRSEQMRSHTGYNNHSSNSRNEISNETPHFTTQVTNADNNDNNNIDENDEVEPVTVRRSVKNHYTDLFKPRAEPIRFTSTFASNEMENNPTNAIDSEHTESSDSKDTYHKNNKFGSINNNNNFNNRSKKFTNHDAGEMDVDDVTRIYSSNEINRLTSPSSPPSQSVKQESPSHLSHSKPKSKLAGRSIRNKFNTSGPSSDRKAHNNSVAEKDADVLRALSGDENDNDDNDYDHDESGNVSDSRSISRNQTNIEHTDNVASNMKKTINNNNNNINNSNISNRDVRHTEISLDNDDANMKNYLDRTAQSKKKNNSQRGVYLSEDGMPIDEDVEDATEEVEDTNANATFEEWEQEQLQGKEYQAKAVSSTGKEQTEEDEEEKEEEKDIHEKEIINEESDKESEEFANIRKHPFFNELLKRVERNMARYRKEISFTRRYNHDVINDCIRPLLQLTDYPFTANKLAELENAINPIILKSSLQDIQACRRLHLYRSTDTDVIVDWSVEDFLRRRYESIHVSWEAADVICARWGWHNDVFTTRDCLLYFAEFGEFVEVAELQVDPQTSKPITLPIADPIAFVEQANLHSGSNTTINNTKDINERLPLCRLLIRRKCSAEMEPSLTEHVRLMGSPALEQPVKSKKALRKKKLQHHTSYSHQSNNKDATEVSNTVAEYFAHVEQSANSVGGDAHAQLQHAMQTVPPLYQATHSRGRNIQYLSIDRDHYNSALQQTNAQRLNENNNINLKNNKSEEEEEQEEEEENKDKKDLVSATSTKNILQEEEHEQEQEEQQYEELYNNKTYEYLKNAYAKAKVESSFLRRELLSTEDPSYRNKLMNKLSSKRKELAYLGDKLAHLRGLRYTRQVKSNDDTKSIQMEKKVFTSINGNNKNNNNSNKKVNSDSISRKINANVKSSKITQTLVHDAINTKLNSNNDINDANDNNEDEEESNTLNFELPKRFSDYPIAPELEIVNNTSENNNSKSAKEDDEIEEEEEENYNVNNNEDNNDDDDTDDDNNNNNNGGVGKSFNSQIQSVRGNTNDKSAHYNNNTSANIHDETDEDEDIELAIAEFKKEEEEAQTAKRNSYPYVKSLNKRNHVINVSNTHAKNNNNKNNKSNNNNSINNANDDEEEEDINNTEPDAVCEEEVEENGDNVDVVELLEHEKNFEAAEHHMQSHAKSNNRNINNNYNNNRHKYMRNVNKSKEAHIAEEEPESETTMFANYNGKDATEAEQDDEKEKVQTCHAQKEEEAVLNNNNNDDDNEQEEEVEYVVEEVEDDNDQSEEEMKVNDGDSEHHDGNNTRTLAHKELEEEEEEEILEHEEQEEEVEEEYNKLSALNQQDLSVQERHNDLSAKVQEARDQLINLIAEHKKQTEQMNKRIDEANAKLREAENALEDVITTKVPLEVDDIVNENEESNDNDDNYNNNNNDEEEHELEDEQEEEAEYEERLQAEAQHVAKETDIYSSTNPIHDAKINKTTNETTLRTSTSQSVSSPKERELERQLHEIQAQLHAVKANKYDQHQIEQQEEEQQLEEEEKEEEELFGQENQENVSVMDGKEVAIKAEENESVKCTMAKTNIPHNTEGKQLQNHEKMTRNKPSTAAPLSSTSSSPSSVMNASYFMCSPEQYDGLHLAADRLRKEVTALEQQMELEGDEDDETLMAVLAASRADLEELDDCIASVQRHASWAEERDHARQEGKEQDAQRMHPLAQRLQEQIDKHRFNIGILEKRLHHTTERSVINKLEQKIIFARREISRLRIEQDRLRRSGRDMLGVPSSISMAEALVDEVKDSEVQKVSQEVKREAEANRAMRRAKEMEQQQQHDVNDKIEFQGKVSNRNLVALKRGEEEQEEDKRIATTATSCAQRTKSNTGEEMSNEMIDENEEGNDEELQQQNHEEDYVSNEHYNAAAATAAAADDDDDYNYKNVNATHESVYDTERTTGSQQQEEEEEQEEELEQEEEEEEEHYHKMNVNANIVEHNKNETLQSHSSESAAAAAALANLSVNDPAAHQMQLRLDSMLREIQHLQDTIIAQERTSDYDDDETEEVLVEMRHKLNGLLKLRDDVQRKLSVSQHSHVSSTVPSSSVNRKHDISLTTSSTNTNTNNNNNKSKTEFNVTPVMAPPLHASHTEVISPPSLQTNTVKSSEPAVNSQLLKQSSANKARLISAAQKIHTAAAATSARYVTKRR